METSATVEPSRRSGWKIAGMVLAFCIPASVLLFLRFVVFQPFNIPSTSSWPNLVPGDLILVSKLGYTPKRGDLAVFKLPTDKNVDYVKRVIGLPGDRIQMVKGVVMLNGTPLPQLRVQMPAEFQTDNDLPVTFYRETLPDGTSYIVANTRNDRRADNTREYVVPEGHYFTLGDNRDNSSDSRFLDKVGYVPRENFVGPMLLLFFNTKGRTLNREPISE